MAMPTRPTLYRALSHGAGRFSWVSLRAVCRLIIAQIGAVPLPPSSGLCAAQACFNEVYVYDSPPPYFCISCYRAVLQPFPGLHLALSFVVRAMCLQVALLSGTLLQQHCHDCHFLRPSLECCAVAHCGGIARLVLCHAGLPASLLRVLCCRYT